jgi:aminopeptidase 2
LKKKFDRYIDGDKYAIHSNLRNLSFRTAIYHSNQEEKHFHAMLDLIKNGESIDIRLSAMSSLGATRNLRLIKKILNEVIFDAELIRSQDIPRLVAAIAYYCPERDAALEILWNWFVQNFDKLHLKLSSTITLFSRLLEYTVNKNIGKDFISKLEDWSSGKHLTDSEKDAFKSKVKNVERSLEQSIESIGANTNWFLRDRTNVLQWLTK